MTVADETVRVHVISMPDPKPVPKTFVPQYKKEVAQSVTTTAQLNTATVTRLALNSVVPAGYYWEIAYIGLFVRSQSKVADPNGSESEGSTASGFTTVSVAAATAGTLTANGMSYLSGFRVDFAAAIPSTAIITVNNLAGGNTSYQVPSGSTSFAINFPRPIAAPYAAPVISVPAIATGPAYTINAYGDVLGSGYIDVAASIFAGNVPSGGLTATASNANPDDCIEPSIALPYGRIFDPQRIILRQGETIYADVWNAIGTPIDLIVRYWLRKEC